MRICYVTLGYPPAFSLGGPVRNAYYLTHELQQLGHHVTVWCSNLLGKHSKLSDRTMRSDENGIQVVRFNTVKCGLLGKNSFGIYFWPDLPTFCRRDTSDFDVFHLDGYRDSPTLIASYFAEKRRVPYLIQARGTMLRMQNSIFAKRLFDALLGKTVTSRCAGFIASSSTEADDYKSFLAPQSAIIQIPNGIDFREFSALPAAGELRRGLGLTRSRVVSYVGRIHPLKGIEVLVRAFARSRWKNAATLVIAGPDENYKDQLTALIATLGLSDAVVFVGALSGDEVHKVYVDSDLVVCPSKHESFGMVAAEAAMCGAPLVVTDAVGCGKELAAIGCASIVRYGDIDGLTHRVDEVLDRQPWPNRHADHLESLRQWLSWPRIAREYETAYMQAARRR
jgi:glycosyltransferase involved in cell wall biosynthesis